MRCTVSKNKRLAVCVLCLLLFLSSGCSTAPKKQSLQFFSMDTLMQFTAYGDHADALQKAKQRIEALDAILDATDPDSTVSGLQNGQIVPQELIVPLRVAEKISAQTDGALDLTLYPLSDAWGFYSKNYAVPAAEEIERLLSEKGNWHLEENIFYCAPQTKLDLGSVAKGYAAVQAAEILKSNSVSSAVLSLGGNVQTIGAKPDGSPWIIAVADPDDPQGSVGNLRLTDEAAVTSGSYQRNFTQDGKLYHHILDPKTGMPAETGLLSVTVVCADGTTADGLSTALFITGASFAQQLYREKTFDFEALFLTENKEIIITEGLADRFEQTNQNYKQPQVLR